MKYPKYGNNDYSNYTSHKLPSVVGSIEQADFLVQPILQKKISA